MITKIIVILACIVMVSFAAAVGLKNGIDWKRDRAESWGKSHMKELGMTDEDENRIT